MVCPPWQQSFAFDTAAASVAPPSGPASGEFSLASQEDRLQRPYRDAGFPELGALDRQLVRWRAAIFGRWEVGSLCGRDLLGRDMLSRLFWGARVSLIVGLVATLVSVVIGVSWGAIAGYAGGFVDDAMMRVVDILYSIPFIFVVIFLLTILGEQQVTAVLQEAGVERITIFFFVVGAIYWLTMARVVRGQVISLKHEQYVEAARALGAGRARIVAWHILPNLQTVIVVMATVQVAQFIIAESTLSFLGLGILPPTPSWQALLYRPSRSCRRCWARRIGIPASSRGRSSSTSIATTTTTLALASVATTVPVRTSPG